MLRPRGKCLILMALLLGDDLAGSIDQSALDLVSSELLSELDYGQEAVNAQRFRQGPGRYCLPLHPTHFELLSQVSNCTLCRCEQ
jgi:hypothetical protein